MTLPSNLPARLLAWAKATMRSPKSVASKSVCRRADFANVRVGSSTAAIQRASSVGESECTFGAAAQTVPLSTISAASAAVTRARRRSMKRGGRRRLSHACFLMRPKRVGLPPTRREGKAMTDVSERVQAVARALCAADGKNPDERFMRPGVGFQPLVVSEDGPQLWEAYVVDAERFVVAIEAMQPFFERAKRW